MLREKRGCRRQGEEEPSPGKKHRDDTHVLLLLTALRDSKALFVACVRLRRGSETCTPTNLRDQIRSRCPHLSVFALPFAFGEGRGGNNRGAVRYRQHTVGAVLDTKTPTSRDMDFNTSLLTSLRRVAHKVFLPCCQLFFFGGAGIAAEGGLRRPFGGRRGCSR